MDKIPSDKLTDDNRVPFIVYEGTIARFERTIRRLIILVGITILLLFASNAIWIYEWNQYDYEDVVVDSQDGGNANYLEAGMNGVINNGKGNGQKTDEENGKSKGTRYRVKKRGSNSRVVIRK